MHESLRGQLLLSAPNLFDPNFRRTVLLIAEHTEDGAMGVVLNRPAEVTVGEVVPDLLWLGAVDEEPVYAGGPVATDSVIVLAEFDDPDLAAAMVLDDVGFVPAVGPGTDEIAAATSRARVFAGHAGWGPGQLEREIKENVWLTCEADEALVFGEDFAEKWQRALAKLGVSASTLSSQTGRA